ncbi:signal transduction histidine kinase [Silvibacterium bohemicum]|uniref:histidine kinase n=1 Tax=Silvibacterium bohemicum TaxID=1577686 RepID=A0A841JWR0_9BACT|nr:ATP-binding protein [Silvibacterium bohemicum]MBB6143421.1 signal transduction histidine kinase [Silvibacterium bohemicum]
MTSESTSVLVVDDRAANRYTTTHALARAGFTIIEAASGKEALELAKKLPAVIVLDVKLPDILGYEVCRRIKGNSLTRHIPVLQLSASFLSNESKLYALESGADAYLIQPTDPVVLVATVRSLVRMHRAESQAEAAAKQWQATFDALSEGVAILDRSGTILRCNRAMVELLDRTYGEIENSSLEDLVRSCFALDLQQEGVRLPREVQAGSRFFRLSLDQIVSQDEATGGILIIAETTAQKRAEEALLASERLAATGRMAHTIAHEINNPLEAITNLTYLLQNSLDKPETARTYINATAKELERVSRISRQILSFHRESSTPVDIRISDLIDDVLALNNRALVDRQIQLRKEWDSELLVQGFPAQLRQVFSNLVRNAVEASSIGGEIRIRISSSSLGQRTAEPEVRVTIADRGLGIPSENRKRIFEAFFTTKALKGSGVGLWLSSTIVHEHGGRLRVRSCTEPSRSGTCMSIILPRRSVRQ